VETCAPDGTQWIRDCAGEVRPVSEVCDDSLDNDCDGQTDEGCVNTVTVPISGDCVTVTCPPGAPHPVGCNIIMGGIDCRGCVAHAAGSSQVYFQEGDICTSSGVQGHLLCSSVPSGGLDASNCNVNKLQQHYVASPADCPTSGGTGCNPSCTGLCGSPDPVFGSDPWCYCDAVCMDLEDCCPDYDAVCSGP
jgi:hypothetical protein